MKKYNYGIRICKNTCISCGGKLESFYILSIPLKSRTTNKILNGKMTKSVRCIKCNMPYNTELIDPELLEVL